MNKKRLETLAVQENKEIRTTRPHILPIYATSSFSFENIEEGIDVFSKPEEGHLYSRFANPTLDTVALKIAQLESFGTDMDVFCLLANSGMSAIHCLLASQLKAGDKVLTHGNIYGGTTELLKKVFSQFGVTTLFSDLNDESHLAQLMKANPEIKLIYFETPANPTLACIDIEKIVAFAKSHNVLTVADNTFATPMLQRPFSYGVDFVLHSTTKYLNGHGNGLGGAILANRKHYDNLWAHYKLIGPTASPFEAWNLNNGLKTLALRMEKHSSNALSVATFLENHPNVDFVNYPGLPSHANHEIAKKQMASFGGMLSFEVKGGFEAGKKFMNELRLCSLAPTLGNTDTLVLHPASMSHLHIDRALRIQFGITDGLIRLSVGIEHEDDIKSDLDKALTSQ